MDPIQDGDFPASYVCLPEGIGFLNLLPTPKFKSSPLKNDGWKEDDPASYWVGW